jgi:fluoride exporter
VARTLTARRRLFAVMGGGFFGAIARYLLSLLVQSHLGKAWPYDILLINITGALPLAFVTALADATFLIGPTRRLFINVGFLGAYTTFSSLALGSILLFAAGNWFPALLYLFLSLGGGVLAVLGGDWLGQWVVRWRRRRLPHVAIVEQKAAKMSGEESLPDAQEAKQTSSKVNSQ